MLKVLSQYNEGCASELRYSGSTDEEGSLCIIEKFQIDIFVRMSEKGYEDFKEDIWFFEIENWEIPYLSKMKLIELKSTSLRDQDRLDVIKLKEL